MCLSWPACKLPVPHFYHACKFPKSFTWARIIVHVWRIWSNMGPTFSCTSILDHSLIFLNPHTLTLLHLHLTAYPGRTLGDTATGGWGRGLPMHGTAWSALAFSPPTPQSSSSSSSSLPSSCIFHFGGLVELIQRWWDPTYRNLVPTRESNSLTFNQTSDSKNEMGRNANPIKAKALRDNKERDTRFECRA